MKRFGISCGAILGLLLLAQAPSIAGDIQFNDLATTLPDVISIRAIDFEHGFSAGGITYNQGLGLPDTHSFPETPPPTGGIPTISFSGTWNTNIGTAAGPYNFVFVEASNHNLVSDILQFSVTDNGNGTATITGIFQSDDPLGQGFIRTLNPNDPTPIVEDGTTFGIGLPNLTIHVSSDLNAPDTPEPASVILFGIGIAGMAGWKWRRNRKQAA
jgi:hypothetical protein